MKLIKTLILLLLSTDILFSQADSLQLIFKTANDYYTNAEYSKAIVLYNKIIEKKYHSPELYYNLANSYLKNNQIPQAILYYEKALKLKPNDEDIRANLDYANMFISSDFHSSKEFLLDRLYLSLINLFTSNTWAILALVFLLTTLSLISIFLFSKTIKIRRISFFSAIVTFIFIVMFVALSYLSMNNITNPNYAIVMQTVSLKSSPTDKGTDIYILNPGLKVQIVDKNEKWLEIRLPNGTKGWVLANKLETI